MAFSYNTDIDRQLFIVYCRVSVEYGQPTRETAKSAILNFFVVQLRNKGWDVAEDNGSGGERNASLCA